MLTVLLWALSGMVAKSQDHIVRVLREEQKAAVARETKHYEAVVDKQTRAKLLRGQIATKERELEALTESLTRNIALKSTEDANVSRYKSEMASLKTNRDNAQKTYDTAQRKHSSYLQHSAAAQSRDLYEKSRDDTLALKTAADHRFDHAYPVAQRGQDNAAGESRRFQGLQSSDQSQISTANSDLERMRTELKRAETPPSAVFQPLPQSEVSAFQLLGHLYMPLVLRIFSRSSFLALQVMLSYPWSVPHRWNVQSAGAVGDFDTSLVTYYNEKQLHNKDYHKPSELRSGKDGAVQLFSRAKVPTELEAQGNRTHIDQFINPSHGVWCVRSLC